MRRKRGGYFSALSGGGLDSVAVDRLLCCLERHLDVQELPEAVFRGCGAQPKITEELTRLPLRVARGNRRWGGLVVAFPGRAADLTTNFVGTPYLRRILYPLLDLHRRTQRFLGEELP